MKNHLETWNHLKKMLFVYNPMAGKEQIKNKLSDIIQVFCKADFEVTIFATQGPEDATRIVSEKGVDYDYVVCSGGDGTMNEVATGLYQIPIEKRPICGYIPAGTVNDFASTLMIPKRMKKAAKLITEGNVFQCDLGQFNDRFFTYVCGFGAFTEVSHQTPQELKNAIGKPAYYLEAIKHIGDIKSHHMVIECDGEVIEDDFMWGFVSNSVSVAGFKAYHKKDIQMDDGVFEALFIKELRNPIEVQSALNALTFKNFELSDRMLQFSGSHIHIVSEDAVQWTVDGEDGGLRKSVTMMNHNKALPILCSKEIIHDLSEEYASE